MIPQADIVAWRHVAPWADDGMVEQDLALSRALVEIYSDRTLAPALAFRGGTALHKLVLLPPSRYSEDLDFVQVEPGPIGSLIDAVRAQFDSWLAEPTRDRTEAGVTLLYRFESEVPPVRRLRLKIEIETREHFTVYGHLTRPLAVASRWFSGKADVRTYELDELLATKLRALYQRRRGRDLFDLWDATCRARVDPDRVVAAFDAYLRAQNLRVTRAEFERNLAAKARDRAFLGDVRPMLAPEIDYDPLAAIDLVSREFVRRLPGAPWKRPGGR
ncbi:MAG: nucleotidyl transferase AbiEii/AbiGii toxin family protein [Candidatus Rokubacteria bacterium]|nr:nucleotidyl transferase AbiEii/AbiGii toxin family protein [Candidatus Rokubacteria bacterium]